MLNGGFHGGSAAPYRGRRPDKPTQLNSYPTSTGLLPTTWLYGRAALYSNTTGYHNTANGHQALFLNTTGIANTANGYLALVSNTTGEYNTAIGVVALDYNTTGKWNTANGAYALYSIKANSRSTAIGQGSMLFADDRTNGRETFNTAIGSYALRGSGTATNNTGRCNTAIGDEALFSNTTGNYNTAIGVLALYANTTGNWNTAAGHNAYFTANNLNNTTCIGQNSGGITNASNYIEIGNTSVTWIGWQPLWSTYSDARIKTQVQENVPGLAFITKLRPVTYHLDIHQQNAMTLRGKEDSPDYPEKYDIEKKQMTGFIAQEVEAAARAVGYDFSGVEKGADEVGMYSLRYAAFVVPLVKGMQEQQAVIEQQQAEIERLKQLETQLQKITAALQSAGILIEH